MAERATHKILARNRKALHEYHVIETFETGVVLAGPEVKSIRAGRVSLAEAFARVEHGEVWVHGLHISPYEPANRWNVDPVRPRKLLLHRREIRKLIGATQEKGLTLIPLDVHLRDGHIKLDLALARGKRLYDKRQALKKKESRREMERAMRSK